MSFGNSSGGRGSYDRKNVKRKKQSFHTRKIRLNTESENPPDLESLKSKVIVSLAHLGGQKFSAEPGGYTFENWMRSFNLLLDDFETRAGPTYLSKEYYSRRLELTSSLFKRDDQSDLENKISQLRDEEQNLNHAIALSGAKSRAEHEKSERDQKIRALEEELGASEQELTELRKRLAIRREQSRESRGFFKRFVSGLSKPADTTPIATLESRVTELDSKIQGDRRKVSELKLKNEKGEVHFDGELSSKSKEELESRLSEVVSEMSDLESRLLEHQQLSEQRRDVTQSLSEEISKISFQQASENSNLEK